MAQFQVALYALFFALLACIFQVQAAPLEARQIGGLRCNIARLSTVRNLSATKKSLAQVDTADAAAADAVATAQSGLDAASDGISTIAQSLFTGQDAPAEARTQVGDGLTSAKAALQPLVGTDPAVAQTMQSLEKTISAGQSVVNNCN
ncbi:unnamed protein product [Cyclocybe aegerita]|uniref:Uncharacterized protein n=1 Tax=Cyclocybe aegerita TaxID=1973307 RepID=A0A8S0WAK1_CYCAE|nr:unnamed protein product [Cyclocybe aegerita]